MPKKASPAATKDDLQQCMAHITGLIGDLEARIGKRIETLKSEMELHFDMVAEKLTTDFRGAH